MKFSPRNQIAHGSAAVLQAQYSALRTQIPLMYALMAVNMLFLAAATYGEVPFAHSVGVPGVLCALIGVRTAVWLFRRGRNPDPARIRRYLLGTVAASVILSSAFGGWGYLLMSEAEPVRTTSIALYVFVGSISCCYCLHALPIAGWCVLLFGALPVTGRLVFSSDTYLMGIGLTFFVASGVILRSLAKSHAAFRETLHSRSEMGALIDALQSSQEHYRHSVELNPQIPWITDRTGAVIELSPRWTKLTGIKSEDALGWRWTAAVHPDDLPHVQEVWTAALQCADAGGYADVRYRLQLAGGDFRWFRARALPRLDADGEILSWYGNLEDIHDQVAAEQAVQASEERYRLASLATNDVIWDVSLGHDHIEWSGAAATVLGYPEALQGTSRGWWVERLHPDDRARVLEQFQNMDAPDLTQWAQEFRFLAGDGAYLHLVARGYVVRDEEGKPARLIGSLQDLTSQKRYEEKLRQAAHYDALTNLPNRVLFSERLEAALQEARLHGGQVQLIVLDVDRFKATNDTLGHDAGDALLCEIAARVLKAVPAHATVARLGGDEFAIICPASQQNNLAVSAVQRLLAAVSEPMTFNGRQLDVSLSAGSATAFCDGQNPEELHKNADLALYAAKGEGSGQVCWFKPELKTAAERQTQMLYDAREALRDDRIVPFYQPKVCLRSGACLGFEALLRWHHHRGLRSPGAIGAALNDTDVSSKLTDRMIERVIADLLFWQDSGVDVGRIAINGAPGDFQRGDFADRILNRLAHAGLAPSLLELEVTESVFVGQLAETVSQTLATLSEAGVKIALDDFGTGYASLTHLKQFPVDTLKIDRSFISRLDARDREDAAIVSAVIHLAKNLGITTVAEGIETPFQAAHVAREGCDIAQGFLFGRPMAAAHVSDVVLNWSAPSVLSVIASGMHARGRDRILTTG